MCETKEYTALARYDIGADRSGGMVKPADHRDERQGSDRGQVRQPFSLFVSHPTSPSVKDDVDQHLVGMYLVLLLGKRMAKYENTWICS